MNKKYMYSFVALLAIGLVSAGLLTYYGQIEQNVNVEQAVILNCPNDVCVESSGEFFELAPITLLSDVYSVKNVDPLNSRNVELVTSCFVDNGEGNVGCQPGEVTTSYVGVLELTKKNICNTPYYDENGNVVGESTKCWQPTGVAGDTIKIEYTIVGDTFKYKVIEGTMNGYTLIYYKDKNTATSDLDRLTILGDGATVIGSIPHEDDWNVGDLANYCGGDNGFDNYKHCRGAKLWAVPNSNVETGVFVWSEPENFYFETDLIVYSNINTITLSAEGGFDFMVENTFTGTGDYQITTEVLPVLV